MIIFLFKAICFLLKLNRCRNKSGQNGSARCRPKDMDDTTMDAVVSEHILNISL